MVIKLFAYLHPLPRAGARKPASLMGKKVEDRNVTTSLLREILITERIMVGEVACRPTSISQNDPLHVTLSGVLRDNGPLYLRYLESKGWKFYGKPVKRIKPAKRKK